MTYGNWLVCQLLIIISTPLQGLITTPTCETKLANEVFEVGGYYFWAPCNYKHLAQAKEFCSNAGGWQHEPKTKEIVDYMKGAGLGNEIYYQGLEKMDDGWTWLRGGEWDGNNPMRKSADNGGNNCSVHQGLIWQQHACEGTRRRYICQFTTCNVGEDCNKYKYCVRSEHNNSLKFCTCKGGYFDTHCTAQYCDTECTNGGTCVVETDSTYSCQCVDGYYGEGCSNDYCVEHGNPCRNEGTCEGKRTEPYYECNCEPGFYGVNCSDNYCAEFDNPCQNQGTCNGIAIAPFYECDCKPGYYGTTCANNYCSAYPDTCKHNGTCHSKLGIPGYNCSCGLGYYGINCTANYCTVNPDTCNNNGDCYSDIGTTSYNCNCNTGYYGTNCTEGYCEAYDNPCENGAKCVNDHTDYLYRCDCRPEYDGRNCSNLRYYTNGDCMYHINKNNTLKYGIALEKCKSNGGELAMVKNENIQEFLDTTIDKMYSDTVVEVWIGGENNGTWKWLDGELIGNHESGYMNWAEEQPQADGQSILMKKASQVNRWYGVQRRWYGGIICEKPVSGSEPCTKNDPCVNGICRNIGCQSICVCDEGYFQRYCDTDDYCAKHDNPCQNGGTCQAKRSVPYYKCNCQSGFHGPACATQFCMRKYVNGKWISKDDCEGSGRISVMQKELQLKIKDERKKCIAGKEWTVFQRRVNGDVDFYRGWGDYKNGFGDCEGDLWLGLEELHEMTKDGNTELEINMVTYNGIHNVAKYSKFWIAPGSDKYTLHVSGFSGNATYGDGLSSQNDRQFTTKDADHDGSSGNCASECEGGWWYGGCGLSNLNGNFNKTGNEGTWWYGSYNLLRFSEMKFRKRI